MPFLISLTDTEKWIYGLCSMAFIAWSAQWLNHHFATRREKLKSPSHTVFIESASRPLETEPSEEENLRALILGFVSENDSKNIGTTALLVSEAFGISIKAALAHLVYLRKEGLISCFDDGMPFDEHNGFFLVDD